MWLDCRLLPGARDDNNVVKPPSLRFRLQMCKHGRRWFDGRYPSHNRRQRDAMTPRTRTDIQHTIAGTQFFQ
ncbi:MAG: hypothetical protein NVS4B8_18970 [Herpetosiphon sp.]